ncbi:cell wall protein [Trichoderma cornu-damae]|uniref:Cell wall protein n=1 Tax=Trichoderma cornu-damae TaxID=654480 RepID=A0A9P8QXN4_9HYPO|nr:cell wall protein [Trichoderma cornu-damae]
MAVRSLAATLFLAASALGRTDLAGCTYTDTVVQPSGLPGYEAYASRIWYVPGTGELCDILDCGGGRAPPKTNVPGCPLYSGTETYSPSYLNLQTKAASTVAATATATSTSTVASSATVVVIQATSKAATAPATTLVTSVADAEITSAPTTAVPVKSSTSSSSAVTSSKELATGVPGHNNATTGAQPTGTFINGAAPTKAAIVGSCLIAGFAACLGML